MITTAKRSVSITNNEVLPVINFLMLDGSLLEDEVEIAGNHFISKNDHKVYGKVESYPGVTKYFLKQYRGGRPGETLVDPYGMFSRPEDLSAQATQRGTRFCEYLQVKPELFLAYKQYLVNRDSRIFRSVEKAILDGEYR